MTSTGFNSNQLGTTTMQDMIALYDSSYQATVGGSATTGYKAIMNYGNKDLGSIFTLYSGLTAKGLTGTAGPACGFKNAGIDIGRMFVKAGTITSTASAGLLSSIPTGCVGLYACKWVNNNYTGPILQLRANTDATNASAKDFYMNSAGTAVGDALGGGGTSLASWLSGKGATTAYVVSWYDQSKTGATTLITGLHHATQSTTTLQPTYDATNKYIDFYTNSNSYFGLTDSTFPTGDSSYTVIVKLKDINSTQGHWLCAGTPSNNQEIGFRKAGDVAPYNQYYCYVYAIVSFIVGTYTSNSIITYDYNSTSKVNNFYQNGSGNVSYTSSGTRAITSNSHYIGTGNNKTAAECLNGQIYHLSIFNTVLSSADRVIMEGI